MFENPDINTLMRMDQEQAALRDIVSSLIKYGHQTQKQHSDSTKLVFALTEGIAQIFSEVGGLVPIEAALAGLLFQYMKLESNSDKG